MARKSSLEPLAFISSQDALTDTAEIVIQRPKSHVSCARRLLSHILASRHLTSPFVLLLFSASLTPTYRTPVLAFTITEYGWQPLSSLALPCLFGFSDKHALTPFWLLVLRQFLFSDLPELPLVFVRCFWHSSR